MKHLLVKSYAPKCVKTCRRIKNVSHKRFFQMFETVYLARNTLNGMAMQTCSANTISVKLRLFFNCFPSGTNRDLWF